MEQLLSLYRETLAEDIKDTLQQANAHTLQRKLYENSDVFGQLSKYDYFHKAFGVPPNPCESVSFLHFWQGVEKAFSDTEPMLNGPRSFDLQKALFLDNEDLNTMRYFRDELLKYESPLPIFTFLYIIDSCSYNAESREFWQRVRDNSCETFQNDEVHINHVSDMVLGHLNQRFCTVHKRTMGLQTMSTCVSIEEEDKILNDTSDLSIISIPTLQRVNTYAEDRYIKLLEDLDACLPALYNKFCDGMEELKAQNKQLEIECEEREKIIEELKSDLSRTQSSMEARCESLQECNTLLKRKLESKDIQLESHRLQVENLGMKLQKLGSCNHEEELQSYKKRCDTLEETNRNIRASCESLEREITATKERINNRVEACVGPEDAVTEDKESRTETWETSQEREQLFQEVDKYKLASMALYNKVSELENHVTKLSQSLDVANRERLQTEEKLKSHIPMELHKLEKDNLNKRIASLEQEIATLNGAIAKLNNDYRTLEEERDSILSTNASLNFDLKNQKALVMSLQSEAEALRTKCLQDEQEANLSSELKRQIEETKICNSELQSRVEAMEKDKLVLISRLDALTTVKDMAEEESTSMDQPAPEPESSQEEPLAQSVAGDNLIRISPALAKTRRLNTLNATKYGHISSMDRPTTLSQTLDPRNTQGTKRRYDTDDLCASNDRSISHRLMRNPSEIYLDSTETASLTEDEENDIFKNTAKYLSEKFNLGVRPAA